jgi:hypothetical protein
MQAKKKRGFIVALGLSAALQSQGMGAMAAPTARAPAQAATSSEEYAGPPLLLGTKKLKVGAYGGLGVAYTRMLDRDGALITGEAALLLDHRLSFGIAGYAFSRSPNGPRADDGRAQDMGTGYAGFATRYAVFSTFPVYGSLGLLLGGGAVALHDEQDRDSDIHDWEGDRDRHDSWERARLDTFFVVQPELTLHANATRWLRFGMTGGYRFTSGVSRFGLEESDLDGVVLGGNVQLGWF